MRELKNYVERFVVADDRAVGREEPVSDRMAIDPALADVDLSKAFRESKDTVIADFERRYLKALLAWAQGNVSKAARKANLDRMYLLQFAFTRIVETPLTDGEKALLVEAYEAVKAKQADVKDL